jgi:hypothetical protein
VTRVDRTRSGLERFGAIIALVFGAFFALLTLSIAPALFILASGTLFLTAMCALGFYVWTWLTPHEPRA